LKNQTSFSKIWRLQSTGWFHKSHKLNRKVGSGHAFYLEIKVAFVVELTARARCPKQKLEHGIWIIVSPFQKSGASAESISVRLFALKVAYQYPGRIGEAVQELMKKAIAE
jgi:hypothetical protein